MPVPNHQYNSGIERSVADFHEPARLALIVAIGATEATPIGTKIHLSATAGPKSPTVQRLTNHQKELAIPKVDLLQNQHGKHRTRNTRSTFAFELDCLRAKIALSR